MMDVKPLHTEQDYEWALREVARYFEILNRVRPLTLDMIRTISKEWNILIESLTAPYELAREYA